MELRCGQYLGGTGGGGAMRYTTGCVESETIGKGLRGEGRIVFHEHILNSGYSGSK